MSYSVNLAVALHRTPTGECIATLGIDLVAVRLAPCDEIDGPDVRSDHCIAFPAQSLFQLLGVRMPFPVSARQAVPVFHDGFDLLPVASVVPGQPQAPNATPPQAVQ